MRYMEDYDLYKEAGKIAGEARRKGIAYVKEGRSYLEVAEYIEDYILQRAELAFPVNISVNSTAAHYTPSKHDEKVFKRGDVVKIDVGAHVDGYIGDTAATVEVGTSLYADLIETAKMALHEAIRVVKAGVKIEEISRAIEEKIIEQGFVPVKNLQGHSLERYNLHAGISIPNYYRKMGRRLKEGEVIAIEPFVTNGDGIVVDEGIGNIYRLSSNSPMVREIKKRFHGLPFAERWLYDIYGEKTPLKIAFLMKRRLIAPYFKLVEVKGGIVSQAEHTLYVKQDGCEILTP
ncbi:MAG: type II methionyl aminopeptidase [Thermoplasmata archaeon]|nr:type II methionyl aminopeptidase [Thermoplasmata archaeon]